MVPKYSAPGDNAARRLNSLGLGPIPSRQAQFNDWGAIIIAGGPSLPQKVDHFLAQSHQPDRGFGTVLVAIDLISDRIPKIQHLSSQGTDFATNFIDPIIHGI
jgi:hypothetical protein